MIKNLVVNLSIEADNEATTAYAVTICRAFEAHLTGIALAYEAVSPAMLVDDVSSEWLDELRAEADAAAKAALASFEETARGSGISYESRRLDTSLSGAADLFGRIARRFDLSVLRQAEPQKGGAASLMIEAALFDTGRPVLIVPYIQKSAFKLERVMVCWDGSRNAARAVGDAMSFLTRAKVVEVAVVREHGKSDELPGVGVAQHLARHGVNVEVNELVSPETDAADALLSHAADAGVDFIVMGGYGHSRLREFVLGGATRKFLASMTAPTLMSH